MAMTYGIHLPQYGRVVGGDAVSRAARHAEDLGFNDVWVSDHIVHPAEQTYPSPFLLDPFATLSWAAAVTTRVRLGTSVLVVPQHNPVWLANHLATVDAMSGGRLIVGAGIGWSKREYDALGACPRSVKDAENAVARSLVTTCRRRHRSLRRAIPVRSSR